jgi:arylsulfatase
VGALLKKLEDLGVADNTIVVYTTDNGNEMAFWPDGGYAPFRGEKGTTWEGGVRVPCLVRWPGKIRPGSVSNGVQSHEDLFVTLASAAGLPDVKEKLLKGVKWGDMTYKVHLDGYDNTNHWMGESKKSARREYFYYDETELTAVRVDGWKMHIGVKKDGTWWNAKTYPSVPYLFNLLMDPLEKMDPESHEWGYIGRKFLAAKLWAPTAASQFLGAHLKTLQEFPPSQGADTLSMHKAIESAMAKLDNPHGSSN